jgi:urease accessory protein
VEAVSAGSFQWIVHRRAATVAFLVTPLLALGDGETLEVSVELEAGTALALTAQGPTSLLKAGRAPQQRWLFRLREGAHLTFLPWVTIPFPGSRSVMEVRAELGPRASLAAWDVLAIGRIARGELFAFEELRASWRIAGPAGVLLDDRLLLHGADRDDAETLLAGRTHLGSLFVAGLAEEALPVALARERLAGLDLAGASRAGPDLLVVRALDRSADRLEQAFWPVVSAARSAAAAPALRPEALARRWFPNESTASTGV